MRYQESEQSRNNDERNHRKPHVAHRHRYVTGNVKCPTGAALRAFVAAAAAAANANATAAAAAAAAVAAAAAAAADAAAAAAAAVAAAAAAAAAAGTAAAVAATAFQISIANLSAHWKQKPYSPSNTNG